jgi:hypothetical protein
LVIVFDSGHTFHSCYGVPLKDFLLEISEAQPLPVLRVMDHKLREVQSPAAGEDRPIGGSPCEVHDFFYVLFLLEAEVVGVSRARLPNELPDEGLESRGVRVESLPIQEERSLLWS